MKPSHYITYSLFATLFYSTLVLLNISPPPTWLNKHMQHASQFIHNRIWHGNNTVLFTHGVSSNRSLIWLAQAGSSVRQSIPHVGLKAMNQALISKLYGTQIEGAWTEYVGGLDSANLTLPTSIIFTPEYHEMDNAHEPILSSSYNGYLNSRIDLRRRKRAFNVQLVEPAAPSPISLHLREDVLFQPKYIDPAVLISRLHEAIKRNQDIEKEKIAQKLRKMKKKKKKESKAKKGV